MNKKEQKTNDKPRKKRKLTVKERVKQRRKKAIITAVVSATAIVLVSVALIVLNVFIPVKYLASYFVVGNRMKNGDLRVSFIDVGYGDCIIIELPDGKNMLIDAGDGRYATNSKVLKELNKRDIDEIDYLICSSVNGEHCGGLFEVLKYKTVKSIFMPYCLNRYVTDEFRDFCEQAEKSKAEIIYSEYKKGIKTNDYFFTVLSPSVKEFENGEYTDDVVNAVRAVDWLDLVIKQNSDHMQLDMNDLGTRIAGLVLVLAQFTFYEPITEQIMEAIRGDRMTDTHPIACPVCGSGAAISIIDRNENFSGTGRELYCGRCGMSWEFDRIRCARCGCTDEDAMQFVNIGNAKNHQIQLCDNCGEFIRTTFVDPNLPEVAPIVEDIVSTPIEEIVRAGALENLEDAQE